MNNPDPITPDGETELGYLYSLDFMEKRIVFLQTIPIITNADIENFSSLLNEPVKLDVSPGVF